MPDSTIKYIDRTRAYYLSQGFEKPYEWAHHSDVPFSKLNKDLSDSRLALITTSMPIDTIGQKRALHVRDVNPPPKRMHTDELSWDKESTHTRDINSFLPLEQLNEAVNEGMLGSLAKQFYCVPTLFSQRSTSEVDAPNILTALQKDQVDVALLVPL